MGSKISSIPRVRFKGNSAFVTREVHDFVRHEIRELEINAVSVAIEALRRAVLAIPPEAYF